MNKLAIITTHPIQYNAPLFAEMSQAQDIQIKVFYTWSQAKETVHDNKFKQTIQWDIPLLEGYDYTFVKNTAKNPGSSFCGINNPTLNKEIEEWGADAILVYGWSHKSHLNAMRYFHNKIKVFFRGDSHLLTSGSGWRKYLRKIWLKWVYSHVDVAFCVGKNNKDYFLKFGLKPWQLVDAPHAVNNDFFSDSPEKQYEKDALEWRYELGFKDDDIVIVYVGKYYDVKNLIWMTKNFVVYQQSHPASKLKLLMVGQGVDEQKLREIAEGRKDIEFLPFQNQTKMPLVYRLGNLLILPSYKETWGLCINEAMACGRAVITSDHVGCAPDLVINNVTGWQFELDNSKAFMDILSSLDLEKLKKIGKNNIDFISHWNYKNIVDNIYRTISQKIKVMSIFPNNMRLYGQERANLTVFKILKDNNYNLYTLANSQGPDPVHVRRELEKLKIPYDKICFTIGPWNTCKPLYWLRFFKELFFTNCHLICRYRQFKPDYLHVSSFRSLFFQIPALLLLRPKIVYRLGDDPPAKGIKKWAFKHIIIKLVYKYVCDSNYIRDKLYDLGRSEKCNDIVLYAPPPVRQENTEVSASEQQFLELLKKKKESGKIIITYFGRVSKNKGVDLIIKAAELLSKNYKGEIYFVIAGTFNSNDKFFIEIGNGLEILKQKNIIYTPGFVSSIPILLKYSDIHIAPSLHEAYGLTVVEAKYAGRCSIIFRTGGMKELVRHKKDGYLCAEKKSEDLVKSIEYYLNNRPMIKSHGENALKSLEKLVISQENLEKEWLYIYE